MIKKTFEFGSHCSGWPTDIGIYRIYCKVNGKSYVGKADGKKGFRQRWKNHQSKARIDKNECILLQRAYKKYGEEYFVFEILEILERGSNVDIRRREWYWMDELDVYNNGYNLTRYTEEDFVLKEIRVKPKISFNFLDKDQKTIAGEDLYQFAKNNKYSPIRLMSLLTGKSKTYKNLRSLDFNFHEESDNEFEFQFTKVIFINLFPLAENL